MMCRSLLLNLAFSAAMMPWSIGWCIQKYNWVVEESIWLVGLAMQDLLYCDPKLSASKTTYLAVLFLISGRKTSWNHHLVSLPSFQAFFWLLYGRGDWRVRKQRGLAAFPIMAKGILCIPVALVHVIWVTRSLAFWALVYHEHVFFAHYWLYR